MVEPLSKNIHSIENQVMEMAKLAAKMLHEGVASLAELDAPGAEVVIKDNDRLAELDEQIEKHILTTLTLQQPVASDLRRTGAALKLITYINRVGRYGYDIAKVTREWPEGQSHVARMVQVRDMSDKVEAMLEMVIVAFNARKSVSEEDLLKLENDVDAMRYAVFREALTYMLEDQHNIERCAHYMMVARYLERCGDNICKMAEKLHYASTGKRILLN